MKEVRQKALTPSSQGNAVQLFQHRNTSSVNTPMFSSCAVFQASLFFRNTMMSDKKTVPELKEASMKPFLLLRGKRQQTKDKAGSRGNALRGRRSLTNSLTSTLFKSYSSVTAWTKCFLALTQHTGLQRGSVDNAGLLHNSKCKWVDIMAMYVWRVAVKHTVTACILSQVNTTEMHRAVSLYL